MSQPSEPGVPRPQSITFQAADMYRTLGAEADEAEKGPKASISREEFVTQASDMWRGIQAQLEKGHTKNEAYAQTRKSYVNNAEHPLLGLQAAILLNAPMAESNARVINEINANQATAPEVRQELWDEKRKRIRAACGFNQQVRNLVLSSPNSFTRSDLENWLERWGRNPVWAQTTAAGVAAEVAMARAAAQIPGCRVEMSTVEEDLRGTDFVLVKPNGDRVKVDVKTGGNQPLRTQTVMSNVQVGVERYEIEGFDISPASRYEVTQRLINLL